jgi:hypothetical protein
VVDHDQLPVDVERVPGERQAASSFWR